MVLQYIKNTILRSMDLFIPQIRIRPHSSSKWFTPNVRHKLNRIHYLRKKAKNRPMDYVLAKLELAESELQAISKYESSLIHDFAFSKSYKIYEYKKSLKKEDSTTLTKHLYLMSTFTQCSQQARTDYHPWMKLIHQPLLLQTFYRIQMCIVC